MIKLEYLKELEEKGIEFSTFIYEGYFKLDSASVFQYAKDPDSFKYMKFAKSKGVSVEVIKQWLSYFLDGQCHGITKKRRRCLRELVDIPEPKDFNPDIDGYCFQHSRL